jgi:hypothetical protein
MYKNIQINIAKHQNKVQSVICGLRILFTYNGQISYCRSSWLRFHQSEGSETTYGDILSMQTPLSKTENGNCLNIILKLIRVPDHEIKL